MEMAITVKDFTEMFGKDVFTDKGMFCGKISDLEINLSKFRVRALVIEATRGSYLAELVGGKKGAIVPYHFVQSIGDVVIIRHITPSMTESKVEESEE
jgi:sporulation protein YlmC with PRC-barrel domain